MKTGKQVGANPLKIMFGVAVGIALICCGVSGCQKGKEAAEAKNTPIVVSPTALLAAYKENSAAADAKYKGKWVQVQGQVNQVEKDSITNSLYFTFKSGEAIVGVQCFVDDEWLAKHVQLRTGETVTVVGKCEGRNINILVTQCEFVR